MNFYRLQILVLVTRNNALVNGQALKKYFLVTGNNALCLGEWASLEKLFSGYWK